MACILGPVVNRVSEIPGVISLLVVLFDELHELVLDLAALPAAGRELGAVFTIEYVDGDVIDAE